MKPELQRQRLLLGLLIANVVITSLHYTDNYLFFEQYPDPQWLTAPSVYRAWLLLTALGGIGYWLYRQQHLWAASLCLSIYALTGLTSPAHYFYGPPAAFSLRMNTLIWLDFLAGLLIVGFLCGSGLIPRKGA
jgi:hypothetical protein